MKGMMSNKNMTRAAWFVAGTFLGGWVLGLVGGLLGGMGGKKR
jgi:hypothetical protein